MQRSFILMPLALCAAGCNALNTSAPSDTRTQSVPAPQLPPQLPPVPAALLAEIVRVKQAVPDPVAPDPAAPKSAAPKPAANIAANTPPNPFVIRAEVLLARARFSPGVVDGQFGSNFKHAVAAYQSARNLPVNGAVDPATWHALLAEPLAGGAVARTYAITAADVAGPFVPDVGEDFVKLAALPNGPQFNTALEALAERFHMSQTLLLTLNPGVNFSLANQTIAVVDDTHPGFAKGDVARVEVTKSDASVRAYDHAGKLIAFYPATVGSTERPSPSGNHKVVGVARNPDYTYDPSKLKWGPRSAGKLIIKPGPNNPVGMVWIDLNAPSYGIHGTPDPDNIGKTASHGCVRLTNWDAIALGAGVQPGVTVQFIGQRGRHKS